MTVAVLNPNRCAAHEFKIREPSRLPDFILLLFFFSSSVHPSSLLSNAIILPSVETISSAGFSQHSHICPGYALLPFINMSVLEAQPLTPEQTSRAAGICATSTNSTHPPSNQSIPLQNPSNTMSDAGQQSPNGNAETTSQTSNEHLNIKVTDGNNEVFFKIKRSTKLEKLMKAFCERQGKDPRSARFLFEGQKVQALDTPADVGGFSSLPLQMRVTLALPSSVQDVGDSG